MQTIDAREFYEARTSEIRARLRRAIYEAADAVLSDESIGPKSLSTLNDGDTIRLGFRDGIGFEITVAEAYRPALDLDTTDDLRRGQAA